MLNKVGNGNKISHTEYLCIMLNLKEFISIRDDFVSGVFRYFDVDGNGLIT